MTEIRYKLLMVVCTLFIVLIPSACGINIAGSSDNAGFSVSLDPGSNGRASMDVLLGQEDVSSALTGKGNLKEEHWVVGNNGAFAKVGVDIAGSTEYTYSYTLNPGEGMVSSDTVEASESLDVPYAGKIRAYAQARNGKGDSVGASTDIVKGSLSGYSNSALLSTDKLVVSQEFSRAYGTMRLDSTSTTWRRANKNQPVSDAVRQGKDITPPGAAINTFARGTIAGYEDSISKSEGNVDLRQRVHFAREGFAKGDSIRSTATAGSKSATRTIDQARINQLYGVEWDLMPYAHISGGQSIADVGVPLGYYVDDGRGETIGGAVGNAQSGDIINVLPGTYLENVMIDKSLAVKGSGAETTIVDGQDSGSVFSIGANNPDIDVALSGMTIQNGGTITGSQGGGVRNLGRLSINECTISKNGGMFGTGGVYSAGTATVTDCIISDNGGGKSGIGGISNEGTITITGSTISGNSAWMGVGGVSNSGTATIKDCTISDNSVDMGSCGGVSNSGMITIVRSTISGNSATGGGGGSYGSKGNGGGVSNSGTATIKYCTISGNSAEVNGAGVYNTGTSTIRDSAISDNSAGGDGGGVYNGGTAQMTIANSTISDNLALWGAGGISNGGTVTITDSTISRNSAEYGYGGVYNQGTATIKDSTISENWGRHGGGILNGGMATITNCIISGNTIRSQIGGGGVYNWGTVTIVGSTVSGNWALYSGGGVYCAGGTTNIMENSTITQNTAGIGGGGGIFREPDATLRFLDVNGALIPEGDPRIGNIVYNNHLGYGSVNNIEP